MLCRNRSVGVLKKYCFFFKLGRQLISLIFFFMCSALLLETMEEVQPPVTPPIDPNGKRSEATLLDLCEVSLFFFTNLIACIMDWCHWALIPRLYFFFKLQKVLSLEAEGSVCDEALKLFTETKRILSANMANIGSGTVDFFFSLLLVKSMVYYDWFFVILLVSERK